MTLPLGILDQAFNICLDLLMIPGCYWPSLCLWLKSSCDSRRWQEWTLLEKWTYCLVKKERWITAWSSLAVLWGTFGMGSSNTHFAVLFHWCPLSSTWGDGGCVPPSVQEPFRRGWQEGLHLRWLPDVDISSRTWPGNNHYPSHHCVPREWLQTFQPEFICSGHALVQRCQ